MSLDSILKNVSIDASSVNRSSVSRKNASKKSKYADGMNTNINTNTNNDVTTFSEALVPKKENRVLSLMIPDMLSTDAIESYLKNMETQIGGFDFTQTDKKEIEGKEDIDSIISEINDTINKINKNNKK